MCCMRDVLSTRNMGVLKRFAFISRVNGQAIDGFNILLKNIPMDMTVIRDLARLYNSNGRNKDAVALYEEARNYYMRLPQQLRPDGDLDTPFDW